MGTALWRAIPPLNRPASHLAYTVAAICGAAFAAYEDMAWCAMFFGLLGGWFACDGGFHFFLSVPIRERAVVSAINDAELCDGLSEEDC